MTRDDFRTRMDTVQSLISRGLLYYSVWHALWPNSNGMRALVELGDFFGPVRIALFENILVQFGKILSPDPDIPSLINLLDAATLEKDILIPTSDLKELAQLREQIQNDSTTLATLERFRGEHIVRLDSIPTEDMTVRKGDVEKLVTGTKTSFSRLFSMHHLSGPRWSNRPDRSNLAASLVLDILEDEVGKM